MRTAADSCKTKLTTGQFVRDVHVLYKTQTVLSYRTVCMVFIPNVVMAKLLAHVSITHDNNNCFGSLYQYFSFGNEMVGRS